MPLPDLGPTEALEPMAWKHGPQVGGGGPPVPAVFPELVVIAWEPHVAVAASTAVAPAPPTDGDAEEPKRGTEVGPKPVALLPTRREEPASPYTREGDAPPQQTSQTSKQSIGEAVWAAELSALEKQTDS